MKENLGFATESNTPSYFAASNSGRGFICYFDKIFTKNRFDKIYIIKGGPGTGKSSLLKAMRDAAISKGYECEGILCSSDPSSYDGVTIKSCNRSIALLDGTSPHTRDTEAPGAFDEIIDLGQFWNSKVLENSRERIIALTQKKSEAYRCAYSLLRSAEEYASCKRSLLCRCIDEEKLSRYVSRILSFFKADTKKRAPEYKLKNAISAEGYTSLPIYTVEDGTHFSVCGSHGASFVFFDLLQKKSEEKELNVTLSPDPLSPDILDAMALPDHKVFFHQTESSSNVTCKTINTERFLVESTLREIKPMLRMLSRLEKSSLDSALEMLSKAKLLHLTLEDIYIGAMDFEKKEKLQKDLIQKIL